MGATFCSVRFPDCTVEKLHEAYKELQKHVSADCGYTGTLAEKPELKVLAQTFSTDEEARAWIEQNNDKCGPAMAAKITAQPHWYVGGWCSS